MKRKDIGGGVFLELEEEFRSPARLAPEILAPRGLRKLRRVRRPLRRQRWMHRHPS
ncbi:MAG: hypothetical protein IT563_14725 [Alphaproteobacteria bacterium]|nr:hypothetical protein [Alphaproteobacteria bacterium]